MPAFPEVSPLGTGNAVRSPAFEFLRARIYSVICARALNCPDLNALCLSISCAAIRLRSPQIPKILHYLTLGIVV
jgi:hypothetical protein